MNKFIRWVKSLIYSIPYGMKGAGDEIMGSNVSGDGNDTTINQQISDGRVARHLLKGEITKEVDELRYRTYKVDREAKNYNYIGHGVAVKKEKKEKPNAIKFSQENRLICNDVLTELNHVGGYGVEKYNISIDYLSPVRFKMQEFLTLVDVYIPEGGNAVTTLHFSDVMNPQEFKSKPFVMELGKLEKQFSNNDTYALSRNDFATEVLCMHFTTFNATEEHPDVISYTFSRPELIGVHHEDGEFKLLYQWDEYERTDLTDKFFNAELEEKYRNKEKKDMNVGMDVVEEKVKCPICGKEVSNLEIIMSDDGPSCFDCFKKMFT